MQHSCALALISTFEHCTLGFSIKSLLDSFYSPFEELIVQNEHEAAQEGASHYFLELLLYLQQKGDNELMTSVLPKYVALFVVCLWLEW